MSKGRWAFRPAALKRTIKAAQDAGLTVSGFRINPQGEIHVETVAPQGVPGEAIILIGILATAMLLQV